MYMVLIVATSGCGVAMGDGGVVYEKKTQVLVVWYKGYLYGPLVISTTKGCIRSLAEGVVWHSGFREKMFSRRS
jgi:hypothetical protein